jgi:hypothetical protein
VPPILWPAQAEQKKGGQERRRRRRRLYYGFSLEDSIFVLQLKMTRSVFGHKITYFVNVDLI